MTLLIIFLTSLLPVLDVDKEQDELILSIKDLPHYEDLQRTLSYEDVSATDFEGFIYKSNFQPIHYDTRAAYWVRFALNIPEGNTYLLEFFDQSIDSIEVNIKYPDGTYEPVLFGDSFLFREKSFDHKNFQVLLKKPGNYEFYVRIASNQFADIRMAVRSINYFVEYAVAEYFAYGIFYGMILIISLYNLLIYLAIKERKNLYYIFYLLSIGLYAMSVDGIAYQYLWPSYPEWNQIAYGVTLFLVIFWAIIFSKKFLNLEVRAPKVDRLLNIVLGLRVLLFLYALLFNHSFFQYRSIEIIPLSIIFYGSVVVFIRGYKPARFFVVANGFLFLGFILKALMMLSSVTLAVPSYYVLHACFLLEMLFLSFALSDRVRILKNNRDRALRRTIEQHEANMKLKDKVNRELENKVAERTRLLAEKNLELEETNAKLFHQSREIGNINSMLDLANWKLKNNIKYIQKERLLNKVLTYDEFREIFPHQESCKRYLEGIKWNDGFRCKRCRNLKSTHIKKDHAHRCTKCGYKETATMHTIFHGVRFPLEKAFYILYLELNQETVAISEISELIDLRKNTVGAFKRKIREAIVEESTDKINIFSPMDLESVA